MGLEADFGDASALGDALQSLRPSSWRLFLACGNSPDQERLEMNLLNASAKHGCEYIVKLSTVRTVLEAKSGGPYKAHLSIEQALAESQVPWTVLRPNLFMQM